MIRRYFEEQMRYLHEAGKAYAEAHPEQARYLNIDSVADRDPYVERLFEGFAFLAGRIHERLDDELPEYTESLCQLLYPHFLKPIPALSLVTFRPKTRELQGTVVIDRGTEIRSQPVGDDKLKCRFKTTSDVRVHPLSLADVGFEWEGGNTTAISLRFVLQGGTELSELELDPLRLHFHANPSVASLMHLFFTRKVREVVVGRGDAQGEEWEPSALGGDQEDSVRLRGQEWIRPGGLADEEALLPYSDRSFSGYRLLQEYLAFRRKFWCVDLYGLDRFTPSVATRSFEVNVVLDGTYPEEKRFGAEQVRLFCTPVVNVFSQDAEPVRVDHERTEYRVRPSTHYRRSMEVYDVLEGVGLEEKTGRRRPFRSFYTFDHVEDDETGYFTTHTRIGASDKRETYLALDSVHSPASAASVDTLSLDLLCTNGSVPREHLQEGMLTEMAPGAPDVAAPTNLTRPTLIRYPPERDQDHFFWKLIGHWSLNFRSVADRSALAGALELYDWTNDPANRRRIEGIREVRWEPKEILHRGAIIRGSHVVVEVQEDHFADEGDVCLFGLVMSEFLAMYATINSFVHLTVTCMPSGTQYQWQPSKGKRPTL